MFQRRSVLPFLIFSILPAVMTISSVAAFDEQEASRKKEAELLLILRGDSAAADKALACKNLAIHGSAEAVADLAMLLPNEQLSSWSRIALEAIPGAEADSALRKAAETLQGRLLIGTINSIGVRRDAAAVDLLVSRLKDSDSEVASAAAVALGRIGTPAAAAALRQQLASAPTGVRSSVAEGCVLCAERLLSAGQAPEAVQIYDEVRAADVPGQRILEATRGAILARGQDGLPLLLETFRSTDKALFRLALSTAREFPGKDVDQALAAEMLKATPERAALMIQAMADRRETVVLAAVLKAAEQGPVPVRLSAIDALQRVGDVSCLPSLLKIATGPDTELAAASRETLAELPGTSVDDRIVALLPDASGADYVLLLELVGRRRIDAVPALLKALSHSDKAVRGAALTSLGETVSLSQLSVLITQVVTPAHAEDSAVAQQALKAASIRMPDREACATALSTAMSRVSSSATRSTLLETIAAVGGTRALATVGAAAKGTDPVLQETSSRLLGEWMTDDAAPVLLDLATSANGEKYRVRALRGYIRIARQFVLPEPQRVEMCRKAFDVSRQTAEKKLVLEVLRRYPSIDTLKMSIAALSSPELKEDATEAALAIAQKLGNKQKEVSALLAGAGMAKVRLEIVKAEFGAGTSQKDVTDVIRKQAGDFRLISLSSGGYNASFGGDPAPGSPKQLRIQYRVNGRPAEASFAEDAVIVLPMPK